MSDLQTLSSQDESRSEIHRQYFYKLCETKAQVDELRYPSLDSEQLQSLSIRRLDDLDVDEVSPCDFGPRYFAPLSNNRLPDLTERGEASEDNWSPRCSHLGRCDQFFEAMGRLQWIHSAHGTPYAGTPYEKSDWVVESMRGRDELPYYEGYLSENNPELFQNPPVFKAEFAYGTKNKPCPHMISDVAESEVAGPEILRSDIVIAIALMKRQLRSLRFTDHHTIPVLILSIQHHAARITQAHFNGEHIFVRRSRQLDLDGDKPTDDAYLLLRWLNCRAIGDTLYGASVCRDETGEDQVTWQRPNNAPAGTNNTQAAACGQCYSKSTLCLGRPATTSPT